MGKKLSNKIEKVLEPRRRSLGNNLKCKLGTLVRLIDFNQDKPQILEAKLGQYKCDFYDGVACLNNHEVEYLKKNDYYHCIVSRIGE